MSVIISMRIFNSDNYDNFEHNSKEEAHLLDKFHDYVNLEKKKSQNRNFLRFLTSPNLENLEKDSSYLQ